VSNLAVDFNQKRPKVFYGWYIVVACLIITLYIGGVVYFGFTAVFEPIAEELGWSYAIVSLAASLRGLEMGLLAPLMGFLVDRWGPRRLLFGGSILICSGFLLLSCVSSLGMFYGAFALIAVGMSTCTGTVIMTAVTNWFRRKAGIVIGIVSSGWGLGGLIVPVVTRLVDALRWRKAMFIVGLGMLVIVLPLSLVARHKPEQYGYQPDGEASEVVGTMEAQVLKPSVELNIPARQALKKRALWHIAISAMFHSFVIGAVVTHVMPYLSSLGIARSFSSLVALLLPVASIGGRLSSGWFSNIFGNKKVLATGFLCMTAGMLFFGYVNSGTMWLLVPFIITTSLGWGFNVTTRLSLQREYFGRDSFGTVLGFVSGIMMLGNMAGAPVAGWVFDTWGTYQIVWIGYSALTLLGAVLVLLLPFPPRPD
jgi:MFS family permease